MISHVLSLPTLSQHYTPCHFGKAVVTDKLRQCSHSTQNPVQGWYDLPVVLEPLDFIARLAALVPAPRVNLTRFHGVFAPHSATRSQIIPCKKAKAPAGSEAETESKARTPAERRSAMTWAQRLKRVFGIDIETCVRCGGPVRIVASIEDAITIEKILMHRNEKTDFHSLLPESRAPPQAELFG